MSPARHRLPHEPGLDGLRGLAVLGVVLFHAGVPWAVGGYLGVSTFFTLSGFLITSLLLEEWEAAGRIDLRAFWIRRLRRLAPALVLTIGGVAAFAALVARSDQLTSIRGDGLAAMAYVANWRFAWDGQSYNDLFAAPSPLLHTWSLAIEEQFYVLFPLLAVAVLWRARRSRLALPVVVGGLAVASTVVTAARFDAAVDPSRLYYGTDTRAAELLAGCLLALALRPGRRLQGAAGRGVAALGTVALLAVLVAWATVPQTSGLLYQGGLAVHAILTVAVLLAAVHPGPVRTVLSLRPLRALGLVSYGVYLYHWPVFLWLDPARTGLDGAALLALRSAVTLALAVLSYRLVESPVRYGRIAPARLRIVAPAAATLVVAALVATTSVPAGPVRLAVGDGPAATRPPTGAPGAGGATETAARATAERPAGASTSAGRAGPSPGPDAPGPAPARSPTGTGLARPATPAPAAAPRHGPSEPLRVLVVGDSVAKDLEPALRGALEATGSAVLTNGAYAGFQLVGWHSDPIAAWVELRAATRPHVAVLLLGAWDEPFVAEHGLDAYGVHLERAVGALRAGGARILAIGMPASVDATGAPRPRQLNEALRRLPDRWPGAVTYIDPDPELSPGGVFAPSLPGPAGTPERVRKVDGIHLCPAGAARLAGAVVSILVGERLVPEPPPSWRGGDWALHPRYDDPRGSCPA